MQHTLAQATAQIATDGDGLGIDWFVLGIVLALVAVLMVLIRMVGLWASATHEGDSYSQPSPVVRPAAAAPAPVSVSGEVTPELVAILTAAAETVVGHGIRVVGIASFDPRSVQGQQNWAHEGRRQIAESHRLR